MAKTLKDFLNEGKEMIIKYQGEPVSGVAIKKVDTPSYHLEKHDVHYNDDHIGHVYCHQTSQYKTANSVRMKSGGKLRKRWGYSHKAGDHYSQFSSKKDAVEELVGHHLRHHVNKKD